MKVNKRVLYMVIIIFVCGYPFAAVIFDAVFRRYPMAYREKTFLDVSASEPGMQQPEYMEEGVVARQTFVSEGNTITSLTFQVQVDAKAGQMNNIDEISMLDGIDETDKGTLAVRLMDVQTREVIEKWETDIDISILGDNDSLSFGCGQAKERTDMNGKTYIAEIVLLKAMENYSVALESVSGNGYKDGSFSLNGQEQNRDLCFTVSGIVPVSYLHVTFWLRIYSMVFLAAVFWKVRKLWKEKMFLFSR